MEHLPDQQRILGPDQSVPVIGHQNIPTQQKPQPLSRGMHDVEDWGIFAIAESSDPRPKIDVDKENAVRQAQPVNVRHGASIALRTYTSKGRAHGQKSTDRGYPLSRGAGRPYGAPEVGATNLAPKGT